MRQRDLQLRYEAEISYREGMDHENRDYNFIRLPKIENIRTEIQFGIARILETFANITVLHQRWFRRIEGNPLGLLVSLHIVWFDIFSVSY